MAAIEPVAAAKTKAIQFLAEPEVSIEVDVLLAESGKPNAETSLDVPAETSRRLACDASLVGMLHARDGTVLDVGRKRRALHPALRRALRHRDPHCRFPGCESTLCEAHHIHHRGGGGKTSLENLVLLCRRHHRAVQEEGWRVEANAGSGIVFRRPDGSRLDQAPALSSLTEPGPLAIRRLLGDAGIDLDAESFLPTWAGEAPDLQIAARAFSDLGHPASVLRNPADVPGHPADPDVPAGTC